MASHVYGPQEQIVSRLTDSVPQTFKILSNKLNAFPNAIIQFEESFLFSKLTPHLVSKLPLGDCNNLPNVLEFSGCLHFATSGNSSVRQLASTMNNYPSAVKTHVKRVKNDVSATGPATVLNLDNG